MTLLDFVFPKRCLTCKKQGTYLCEDCFSYLSFDDSKKIYKKRMFDDCFSALSYNKTSQKLLNSFKNKPYLTDLKETLGELFYESLIQQEGFSKELNKKNWVLTFVPLSKASLRKRGYNQSEILAKYLANKFNIKIQNIQDVKSGKIFLVDDFIETGETLNEFSSYLKENGAERIIGLTLIRK